MTEIDARIVGFFLILGAVALACVEEGPPDAVPPDAVEVEGAEVEEAVARLDTLAEEDREGLADMTFDEFKATVYREPFEGGKYIVNGDTPILNDKLLQEFFEEKIQRAPEKQEVGLIVHNEGADAVWNSQEGRNLTYCVSNAFGSDHETVVHDMEAAGGTWEAVSAIDFSYVSSEDANCTPANANVVFDVRPVDHGDYLARAFFPNDPRLARNVLIDQSSLELPTGDPLQLEGVLRHELGHALGFRHEHTRPESGTCFEDSNWTIVTDYDGFSVMHYPQCNGLGDWTLTLTSRDKNGAACVYGPASGFAIDTTLLAEDAICGPVSSGSGGAPSTETVTGQSVARGEENQYGPFQVAAGTLFEARMTSGPNPGDPDLYVRFRFKPRRTRYDCRPFLDGAEEICALDVPVGQSEAFVMVRGYTRGSYNLQITHTSPSE